MKLLIFCYVLVTINAASYGGGQKISLDDIERDLGGEKATTQTTSLQLNSPTKFGFVPHRTAASYATSKPKLQYYQANYQVKKSKPVKYQSYSSNQPQYAAPQYSSSSQQYQSQYSSAVSTPQYHTQQYQPSPAYAYVQPEAAQQYAVQYQQPQYQQPQYQQYENVQYVTDNTVVQPETQPSYAQPQYYYVPQYTASSTAVESIIDPKGLQYVIVPTYNQNSISAEEKDVEQYSVKSEPPRLPPVTTTVAKFTKVLPAKSPKKHYSQSVQYQLQPELVYKREPKSLLDSYVPSLVQLQYLKQQGKGGYSKL